MNTQEYLQSHPKVGFTESMSGYKIGEPKNPTTYAATCRSHPIEVTVSTAMVDFGGYSIACAVTSNVSVAHLLPLGGFGSHCHHDEAKVMEAAIAKYCEANGYTICRKENSWPYAVAVITNYGKGYNGLTD